MNKAVHFYVLNKPEKFQDFRNTISIKTHLKFQFKFVYRTDSTCNFSDFFKITNGGNPLKIMQS